MSTLRTFRALHAGRLIGKNVVAVGAAIIGVAGPSASRADCIGSVCTVTVGTDPGTSSNGATGAAGTLSYALAYANAQTGPVTINISSGLGIKLSGPLSPIFNSVTINGNGATIDGA